jgi:Na+/melibiose symporter-like transporter
MLVGQLLKLLTCNAPFPALLMCMLFLVISAFHLRISFIYFPRSMVNCMTSNPTSRVALVSCRNAFTMVRTIHSALILPYSGIKITAIDFVHFSCLCQIANLSLYGIALLMFSLLQSVSVIVQVLSFAK